MNRAVRLYSNKASRRSKTLFLEFDYAKVFRVNLRNHHRNIRRPAVGAVIGNHRNFRLCIGVLNGSDLFLRHIDGAEDEINGFGYLLHLVDIHNYHVLNGFRHRSLHLPASSHRLLIGSPSGSGACRHCGNLIPGMLCQKRNKTLSYHTSCT